MRNRRQTRSACSYFTLSKIISFFLKNISSAPAYATIILLASKALFANAQVPSSGLVFAVPPLNTTTNGLILNNVQQINFGHTNAGFSFNKSSNSSISGTGLYPGDYSTTSVWLQSLVPMEGSILIYNSGGYSVSVNPEFYNASYIDPNAPFFNCGRGFLKINWEGLIACGPTLSVSPTYQNWTHLAVSIGYPESVFVYLNGMFVDALEFTTSENAPNPGPGYKVGTNFTGQLANLLVYDSALSSTQITSIYNFQSNALINNLSLAAPSSSGLASSSISPSSSRLSSSGISSSVGMTSSIATSSSNPSSSVGKSSSIPISSSNPSSSVGVSSSVAISSSNPSSSVGISSSATTSSRNPSSSVSMTSSAAISSSNPSSSIAKTSSSSAPVSSSTGRMLTSIFTAVSSIETAASSSLLASSSTLASSSLSESSLPASSSGSSSSQFESSDSSGTNEIHPDEIHSSSTNYPTYAKALTGLGAGGFAIATGLFVWCCCFVGRKPKEEEVVVHDNTMPVAIEMFQHPTPG